MKYLLLLSWFISLSCSSMPVYDVADSPASLNQRRLLVNGSVGLISNTKTILIRTYTTGTFSIQGQGECSFYEGYGYKGQNFTYDLSNLPPKPVCLLNLHLRDNYLDAPIIGMLLVRRFSGDISPLNLQIDNSSSEGTGLVQISNGGDKTVSVRPKGTNGTVYISGCGTSMSYDFSGPFQFNLKAIYPVDKDCVFDILANNNDFVKEGASLLVAVFNKGSFLDAPTSRMSFLNRKRCFTFQDKYVGLTIINGKMFKSSSGCVSKTSEYIVEGVTSKGRTFYGKYIHPNWVWVK